MIIYDKKNHEIIPLNKIPKNIHFQINTEQTKTSQKQPIKKTPICYEHYLTKFHSIQNEIKEGNTYLINLTTQTTIDTNLSLDDIYKVANSKYKLLYKNKFVCFSPESFCKISNNKIYTYPMKGTIDATIPNAENIILNDDKELAEHTMVVDLLRNDLSIVSSNVKVEKFRYCEKIKAGEKELLQISSKISGELGDKWQNRIGDIITSILPAGSITGTPKKKTIQIIEEVEKYPREYFTGVFGVFDGETLNSAVMIRFIEKQNDKYIYKSGGGITCDSDPQKEYQEMLDKVYIP
jgi:para-aminobenzoate synthetase component 1